MTCFPWEVWDRARAYAFLQRCGTPLAPSPEHVARLTNSVELLCGYRLLDVGCGLGHLYSLLPANMEYTGIDSSAQMITLARSLWVGSEAYFRCARVEGLDANYDVACAHSVLTHVPETAQFLRSLWQRAPVLVVNIPLCRDEEGPETTRREKCSDGRYLLLRSMTRKAFAAAVAAEGGKVDVTRTHVDCTGRTILYARLKRRVRN